MPITNLRPSVVYKTVGGGAPISVAAAGTLLSGWLDCQNGNWLTVVTAFGVGTGTVTLTASQATSNAGAGAKAITGFLGAFTALTQAAAAFNQADLDLHNNLDITNNFRWVQLTATVTGGAGTLLSLVTLVGPQRFLL